MTESLFAVYVGGMIEGCHVELHDMRFVAGETVEACYDDLRAQWWGTPESLHLDAWARLDHADGFDISLSDSPSKDEPKLWFVNLGGYDPALFTELHRNVFVVAPDRRVARRRALAGVAGWVSPHKDAVREIETLIDVAAAIGPTRHIRLTPARRAKSFDFEARYTPIGKTR